MERISNTKELKRQILLQFIVSHRLSRKTLMLRMWPYYTHLVEIDEVLNDFQHSGLIAYAHSIQKYVMPGTIIEDFRRRFSK